MKIENLVGHFSDRSFQFDHEGAEKYGGKVVSVWMSAGASIVEEDGAKDGATGSRQGRSAVAEDGVFRSAPSRENTFGSTCPDLIYHGTELPHTSSISFYLVFLLVVIIYLHVALSSVAWCRLWADFRLRPLIQHLPCISSHRVPSRWTKLLGHDGSALV